MKKMYRLFIIALALMFVLSPASLAKDQARIYDEAHLLTDSQRQHLEEMALEASKRQKTDFVVLTTDGSHGIDLQIYMEDFVDEHELGFDPVEGNLVILGIDMAESDVIIMGFERAKERLDNDRSTKVRKIITPYLSKGDYVTAFESFIERSERYMRYRPGVDPDNILYQTPWQFGLALILGGLITFILVRRSKPRVTTRAATYRNDQLTRVLHQRDRYVRTSVTKSYRPRNKDSGGGGSGGGGGGSFGQTGGGRSYSGSRGKF